VLAQRFDWTELREVQEEACRTIRKGGDALIIAPTAGGKSEAALIPVMDDLLKHGRPGIACLYISPLKALINDQEERFRTFCTPASLSVMKWHGDVARGERSWMEGEPPHFLMITPESLEVLLQEKTLAPDLRQVRFIIIDELHAFVESGRGVHLRVLLHRMDQLTRRKIQRIGLAKVKELYPQRILFLKLSVFSAFLATGMIISFSSLPFSSFHPAITSPFSVFSKKYSVIPFLARNAAPAFESVPSGVNATFFGAPVIFSFMSGCLSGRPVKAIAILEHVEKTLQFPPVMRSLSNSEVNFSFNWSHVGTIKLAGNSSKPISNMKCAIIRLPLF